MWSLPEVLQVQDDSGGEVSCMTASPVPVIILGCLESTVADYPETSNIEILQQYSNASPKPLSGAPNMHWDTPFWNTTTGPKFAI